MSIELTPWALANQNWADNWTIKTSVKCESNIRLRPGPDLYMLLNKSCGHTSSSFAKYSPMYCSTESSPDSGLQTPGAAATMNSGSPASSSTAEYRSVRTLYACVAEHETELSFEPNQIITSGKSRGDLMGRELASARKNYTNSCRWKRHLLRLWVIGQTPPLVIY